MKNQLLKLVYWIGIRVYTVSAAVFLASFLAADVFLIWSKGEDLPMIVAYSFVYGAFVNGATIPFVVISMMKHHSNRNRLHV